jgi:AraC-like DNA-binding protein
MQIRSIGVNATGSIGLHRHVEEGVYEFHYFLDGSGVFTNAGVPYPVAAGSLFFSAPDQYHKAEGAPQGPRMVIYNVSFVPSSGSARLLELVLAQFKGNAHLPIGKGYGLFFEDLRRKALDGDDLLKLAAEHRLLAFICEILNGQTREHHPRGQLYVDEALNVMQASITGSLNLDALVAHLGIEKSYFIRLFGQAVGMPPVKYFLNMKMDAARNSLRDQDKSVRQVAQELGYDDEFYFSRVFKQVIGSSPQGFRKSLG